MLKDLEREIKKDIVSVRKPKLLSLNVLLRRSLFRDVNSYIHKKNRDVLENLNELVSLQKRV